MCLHFNVCNCYAPRTKRLSCEHQVNRLFCSSHFLVQHGWTRCPQVFSIFSFYDCGINVQIETSLLPFFGDSSVDKTPVLPNRRPTNAELCLFPWYSPKLTQEVLRKLKESRYCAVEVKCFMSQRCARKEHNTHRSPKPLPYLSFM